jgi:hypothetical protein
MEQPEITQDSEAEVTAEEIQTEAVETEVEETEEVVTDSDSSEQPDDSEEVEYEGEKYKVPKVLKDALLRQADYTKKTQSLAEQRKQFESQQAQFKQQSEIQQKYIRDYAEVVAIDKQLEQYKGLDWQSLIDSDPVQAMKIDKQFQMLREQREQAAGRIYQNQQQTALEQQQAIAKRIQEGQQLLEREIKGWSPDLAKTLRSHGTEYGFSDEEMGGIDDPRMVKVLHEAYLYRQLQKKQTTKPIQQPVKPVTKVTASKSGGQKDPDKMSVEEWTKWRESQLKRSA